jgi:UDP-2,3-diacylglucosamine pyrophosphatase LpxH
MMKVSEGDLVFISDVHLGGFSSSVNSGIESDLISFIDFCRKSKLQIIILGDLFDYWMEYRGYSPPYGEKVLKAFESYNQGHKTLYITGNHDNWTGSRLERAGFEIEHEYRYLKLGKTNVLLLHGDGLNDESFSLKRPFLNRFLRNKWFLSAYQSMIPPKLGVELMRRFSGISKKRSHPQKNCSEKMQRWALEQLKQSNSDVIICGHFHQHRFIKNTDGLYINLGNFYKHRMVAIYTKESFSLVTWDAEKQQFVPLKAINN